MRAFNLQVLVIWLCHIYAKLMQIGMKGSSQTKPTTLYFIIWILCILDGTVNTSIHNKCFSLQKIPIQIFTLN